MIPPQYRVGTAESIAFRAIPIRDPTAMMSEVLTAHGRSAILISRLHRLPLPHLNTAIAFSPPTL